MCTSRTWWLAPGVHDLEPMDGKKDLTATRAALFQGLYDGSSGRSTPAVRSRFGCSGRTRRVRLLNPDAGEVDRISRRFSLIEID
jgi:hypothetical protein